MKLKIALHWQIIIGLLLGIVYAFIGSSLGLSQFTTNYITPFGDIFINLLKLIAVPLVLFSIISGISGLGDPASLGRMGAKTLAFYIGTTVVAVILGLLLVNFFQPGKIANEQSLLENRIAYELWAESQNIPIIDEQCYSCKNENQELTHEIAQRGNYAQADDKIMEKMDKANKSKERGPLAFLVDMVPDNIFVSLNNNSLMLQVIFFGIFFGICLLFIPGENAQPVIQFVNGINAVFLKMVDFVMIASPFFVFCLLAGTVAQMAGDNPGQVLEIFKGLSTYTLVVILGLALMVFGFYPLLTKIFVKRLGFLNFLKGITPAQLLAFSSSSSAATLPITMECVEQNLKVDKKITSFVLPIGATVNMDGTSLYQAVAVLFLAQIHMVDLTLAQQLTIVLTATMASIGSAAVPSAGLIMLIIVLQSVDLNPAWIALILPVDRILDMCRTVVNVTGDAAITSIIAESEDINPQTKQTI